MQTNSKSESGIFAPRMLLACALCLLSAFLGAFSFGSNASVSSTSAGNWSIFPSPDLTPQGLGSVTCVSASDCWAVGSYANKDNFRQTLIEHWNGSAWSIVPSPNSSATESNYVSDIACTSSSNCWVVGRRSVRVNSTVTDYTLIERWDGTTWSIVSSPNTSASNRLRSVTCTLATDCWAVGYSSTGTLVEHWDGGSWSIFASPSAAAGNQLNSVACASASDCWTVGRYSGSGSYIQTLIEHWNGSAWSLVTSPNTASTQDNYLYGITCASSTNCSAVGFSYGTGNDQTLIVHWDGNAWSIVSSPNVAGSNSQLYDVACASASDCWAVGYSYSFPNPTTSAIAYRSLIAHWNGSVWSIVPAASSSLAENNEFAGVTCTSTSQCWAVGDISANTTLIEQWNGTSWWMVASPNAAGAGTTNVLSGVTCISISDCWAVGTYKSVDYGSVNQTLIEHWNGSAWSVFRSPNTSVVEYNYLNSVSCTSASDCWAVGIFDDGSGIDQTLIQHWNGHAWSIINSPNPAGDVQLLDISCTSSSNCWAVGYFYTGNGGATTLIEHWNGSAWSIVASPNPNPDSTGANYLNGVSCTSTTQCSAVGSYSGQNISYSLIERWNGSTWSTVSSPNAPNAQINSFSDVTCNSASDCWAVGTYRDGNFPSHTLAAHWDGLSWSLVTSPSVNGNDTFLSSVSCASASNCWASGSYLAYVDPSSNMSFYQVASMHWDGASWSLVTTPSTSGADSNDLRSMTCPSASRCWAVGYFTKTSGIGQTLIEEFTPIPPLTSVVSRMSHGAAGTFDIVLAPTGTPTIECRSGSSGGNYTMVFNFTNPLTSVDSVSASASSPSGLQAVTSSGAIGVDPHQYVVSLSGVPNAQHLTVSLGHVQDAQGNIGDLSQQMDLLIGDTTGDGNVNSGDIAQTKSQSGIPVTSSNFREDVTADGSINSGDIALVKSKSGTALP